MSTTIIGNVYNPNSQWIGNNKSFEWLSMMYSTRTSSLLWNAKPSSKRHHAGISHDVSLPVSWKKTCLYYGVIMIDSLIDIRRWNKEILTVRDVRTSKKCGGFLFRNRFARRSNVCYDYKHDRASVWIIIFKGGLTKRRALGKVTWIEALGWAYETCRRIWNKWLGENRRREGRRSENWSQD